MNISGCPVGIHLSRLAESPTAAQVCVAADGHWRAVADALSPIIGIRGVEALYRRSVYLARVRHNYLPELAVDATMAAARDAMHDALSVRPGTDAASAQITLLQTFNDLLENLIGSSLTDRLLAPVWQSPPAIGSTEDDVQ